MQRATATRLEGRQRWGIWEKDGQLGGAEHAEDRRGQGARAEAEESKGGAGRARVDRDY
jgi:hypothetical protein